MTYCGELSCSQLHPCPLHKEAVAFTFGAIADIQYGDREDGHNYERTVTRRYRHAFDSVVQAACEWKQESLVFIAQLGDIIDGSARHYEQPECAVQRVLDKFNPLSPKTPAYPFLVHTVGNHELYNFGRDIPQSLMKHTEALNPKLLFHSFSPIPGWRFIVLDSFDLSILGWEPTHPKRQEAMTMLKKHNLNDVESDADWRVGLKGLDRRWMPYNGALGNDQLTWLERTLERAESKGERAIILTHVPICPGAASDLTLLWNYDEVLRILHSFSTVVAVLAGHEHDGGYMQDDQGIHHVTFPSPLETPLDKIAFASVDVYSTKLEIRGRGTVPSRTLPFRSKGSR